MAPCNVKSTFRYLHIYKLTWCLNTITKQKYGSQGLYRQRSANDVTDTTQLLAEYIGLDFSGLAD